MGPHEREWRGGPEKAEEMRTRARECYVEMEGQTPILSDDSTIDEVVTVAGALREVMTITLDKHVCKKRWCSQSKPW